MSYDAPLAPTLFDLLARCWTLPGGVEAVCFNRDGSAMAFAGGGELAIAPLADPERPEARLRIAADTARRTILPRTSPVRPAARAEGLAGPVAPWGGKSFVTGRAGGGLVSVTPRGQVVPLAAPLDGEPAAIARDPASAAVAVGDAGGLVILPDDAGLGPRRVDLNGPVTAVAYAPDGRLAAAQEGRVLLWASDGEPQTVPLEGTPERLSWSPDGAFLACGLREPGFALIRLADGFVDANLDYPTPVASFAWSPPARAFATSGAFRTIVWALTPEGLADPLAAGRTGLVIVERVAAAPGRPLLAVGYASGLICLSKIGGRDEMLLRGGGAAVTALAFAADGAHLAVGDAAGEAALIALPDDLFK